MIEDTFLKASFSMDSSESGSFTVFSCPQLEKVPSSMVEIPSDNSIVFNAAQSKACAPIEYGVEELMITVSNEPHPLNA